VHQKLLAARFIWNFLTAHRECFPVLLTCWCHCTAQHHSEFMFMIIITRQLSALPGKLVACCAHEKQSVALLDYDTTQILLHPFNSLFSSTTWVSRHQSKPFWILLEQEMIGWQWHQLDHMQIICASLLTDNHVSTSPLSFYRPDALPATQHPTNSVKALKAEWYQTNQLLTCLLTFIHFSITMNIHFIIWHTALCNSFLGYRTLSVFAWMHKTVNILFRTFLHPLWKCTTNIWWIWWQFQKL